MRTDLLEKISPAKEYSLNDIIDLELIPTVKSYAALYKIVTEDYDLPKGNKKRRAKKLVVTTGKGKLRAFNSGNSWTNINGKIKVKGQEIIVFLKVNGLLE